MSNIRLWHGLTKSSSSSKCWLSFFHIPPEAKTPFSLNIYVWKSPLSYSITRTQWNYRNEKKQWQKTLKRKSGLSNSYRASKLMLFTPLSTWDFLPYEFWCADIMGIDTSLNKLLSYITITIISEVIACTRMFNVGGWENLQNLQK